MWTYVQRTTTASDPPTCTDNHAPDADCHVSAFQTRLPQVFWSVSQPTWYIGCSRWLDVECDGTASLSSETLWPLRRSLISLRWLRVPERIKYKIALLTYKVLHGSASWYLEPFVRVADLPGRRALCSSSTSRLVVTTFTLSTVGSRIFEVSGPLIWNELPKDVVSAPSLLTCRRWFKHFSFRNPTRTS